MPTENPYTWKCPHCGKKYPLAQRNTCLCEEGGMRAAFEEVFGVTTEKKTVELPKLPSPPTKKQLADVAVIVGRFQCPYVHAGYQQLIETALQNHSRVILFIGQSPLKAVGHDPLDYAIRFDMLNSAYPDLEIHMLPDVGNVERWSKQLDRLISLVAGPGQSVVLYGSRDCFAYSGRYEREIIVPRVAVSSTEIRKQTGLVAINSEDFRKGIIWATQNRWPVCYPTVDMAIIDLQKSRLLMGKKPGETLWRFPGGFADVDSDSFEDDAVRETREETSLVVKSMQYLGSKKVNDWRYRNQPDKIKTLFYVVTEWTGEAKAADDLEVIEWLDLNVLTGDDLAPNHQPLFVMLLNWRNRLTQLTRNKKSA